jgi:hypothetical protein
MPDGCKRSKLLCEGSLIHMNLVPMWNISENENVKFENLWVTDFK